MRTGYDRKRGNYKPIPKDEPTSNDPYEIAAKQAAKTHVINSLVVALQEEQKATKKSAGKPAVQTASKPKQNSAEKVRSASAKKAAKRATPKAAPSPKTLEGLANTWLGTRYKMGGTTKKGIDCSGYVMVIYKELYNIDVPHNAAAIYKDSRGKSVSRGDLREGDLVFFGDFWGISHIGIYLNGDRFTHASTSRGVMISPMNDKYWSPKYKGARRFR
ncbi:MAG: NlpC/P60 family protein [Fibrobacter sp.]|nr:NlpC/P60 family protein [Fibrobacter sp.]